MQPMQTTWKAIFSDRAILSISVMDCTCRPGSETGCHLKTRRNIDSLPALCFSQGSSYLRLFFVLFQSNGPGNGGFNRAFVDEFLGKLPCNWPGVRHVIVPDSASAAEHIAGLTRAIAEQPFRAEVVIIFAVEFACPPNACACMLGSTKH